MHELFPLFCGLLLGVGLGALRPGIRLPIGAALSVVLGVLATMLAGEWEVSWGFVLIDIPEVALAAFLGLVAVRQLRPKPQ
jgi:hypothetical protein